VFFSADIVCVFFEFNVNMLLSYCRAVGLVRSCIQVYSQPSMFLCVYPLVWLTEGISISDSIAVMAGYADVVVLRHPEPGAVSVSVVTVCVTAWSLNFPHHCSLTSRKALLCMKVHRLCPLVLLIRLVLR